MGVAKDMNESGDVGVRVATMAGRPAGPAKVWVVVQSKVGAEKTAAVQLEKQGFEVYLPLQLIERNRQGRRDVVSLPFLPRYLFAHVTTDVDHWKAIYRTIGVHTVLGGMKPIGVKDYLIERIRAAEDGGFIRMGLSEGEVAIPGLEKGGRVRVDLGSCDLEGLFIERVDGKRAMILVSLLQRDSRITVDLRKIRTQAT